MQPALSPSSPIPGIDYKNAWLHRWIYYLAAGFMFAAATLRALIIYQLDPDLGKILLVLAAWLVLFIGNALFSRRLPWLTVLILALEVALTMLLLLATRQDFFAFLFSILGMQAMQQYSPRVVGLLIGLCAVLTFLALVGSIGWLQAFALALIYSAGGGAAGSLRLGHPPRQGRPGTAAGAGR